ncbi:hypothetical protein [Natronosalvus rutilus]|uniref:Uncharacterized protein n=1 Tax=Natronosalvus rutilus TaxID=2953753 RepID=A0A9E7N9B9_9EURY|nr:hypothetical protein [Natronosalvus rutilus]UTF52763.1 hypothetical protein NGM29_13350 [Natronosalvus rutilus]
MTTDASSINQRHRRRYLSGTYNSIDEITDPGTVADESSGKWREYIVNNKLWVFLTALLAVGVFVLAFRWIATTMGNLLSNRWAQLALGAFVLAAVSYYAGRRHQLGVFTSVDEFVAQGEHENKRYFCEYVTDTDGKNERVEVYKGFTRFGNPGSKLKVRDLDPEWARLAQYRGYDADDPAPISIHRELATVSHTEFGTIVAQPTNGIDAFEGGGKSVLEATIPDMTRENKVPTLKKQLEEKKNQVDDLEDKIQTLTEQRDKAYEMARKAQDEVLDPFIDRVDRVMGVRDRRRNRSSDDSEGTLLSREPTADDLGTDIQIEDD